MEIEKFFGSLNISLFLGFYPSYDAYFWCSRTSGFGFSSIVSEKLSNQVRVESCLQHCFCHEPHLILTITTTTKVFWKIPTDKHRRRKGNKETFKKESTQSLPHKRGPPATDSWLLLLLIVIIKIWNERYKSASYSQGNPNLHLS